MRMQRFVRQGWRISRCTIRLDGWILVSMERMWLSKVGNRFY